MFKLISRLSFGKTFLTIALACVMITASVWQRHRYSWKSELVKTYKENSTSPAPVLPVDEFATGSNESLSNGERTKVEDWRFRKVSLRGHFDYEHEIIVTNRRDVSGPGHHLLTPFIIDGSNKAILVSRGFIPFEDRSFDTWKQWDFAQPQEIKAVVQECLTDSTFGPSNPRVGTPDNPERLWFFEECAKIGKQLPYPLVSSVFVQQLGGPPEGEFPKEAVSIQIPPSTHFGYMLEWALLAILTLTLGIGLQLLPLHPLGFERLRLNEKGGPLIN